MQRDLALDLDIFTTTSTRALFAGRNVHKIKSQYASVKGRKNPIAGRPTKNSTTALINRDDESIRKSITRSQKSLKQHFLCNFYENYTLFITLSFTNTKDFEIRDVKQCVEQFSRFKKRLAMHIKRHKKQASFKCFRSILSNLSRI